MNIETKDWQLVHKVDGTPVALNECAESISYGRIWFIAGTPPHHELSSGRVEVADLDGPFGEFFPHCFDLEWQRSK